MQCYSQNVAGAQTPKRRHVLSIVKHALKLVASNRVSGRRGNEINVQPAVMARYHHRIRKRRAGSVSLCARARADDRCAQDDKTCWPAHFSCQPFNFYPSLQESTLSVPTRNRTTPRTRSPCAVVGDSGRGQDRDDRQRSRSPTADSRPA
jgi:hypothetical protein